MPDCRAWLTRVPRGASARKTWAKPRVQARLAGCAAPLEGACAGDSEEMLGAFRKVSQLVRVRGLEANGARAIVEAMRVRRAERDEHARAASTDGDRSDDNSGLPRLEPCEDRTERFFDGARVLASQVNARARERSTIKAFLRHRADVLVVESNLVGCKG